MITTDTSGCLTHLGWSTPVPSSAGCTRALRSMRRSLGASDLMCSLIPVTAHPSVTIWYASEPASGRRPVLCTARSPRKRMAHGTYQGCLSPLRSTQCDIVIAPSLEAQVQELPSIVDAQLVHGSRDAVELEVGP